MRTRIPIKAFVDDLSLSWEGRFRRLEVHHAEETRFLIRRIEELEVAAPVCSCGRPGHIPWCGSQECT